MFKPDLEFLFTVKIIAGAGLSFGAGPAGQRAFAPITGGTFEGPRLKGHVAPHGGDWPVIVAPGRFHLDVRAHLVTESGAAILMTYTGRWLMSPEVMARAFNPVTVEAVRPEEQYYRTAISFETGSPDVDWLNDLIAVGVGRKTVEGVSYEVFAVA